MLTAYGKDSAYGGNSGNAGTDYKWFFDNFLNKPERIKYINKEKTAQWLTTGGLKVPKSYGSHRRFLDNSIATERDLVKRKLEYPELYQKQGEKTKGAILPQVDGSYIISLFKHADASTVIHETGHYFVETLVEEALANPDNKQLNNGARILLEYAGTNLEAWRNWDVDSKRPAHEILANAFETLVYIFCIYKNIVIMVIG